MHLRKNIKEFYIQKTFLSEKIKAKVAGRQPARKPPQPAWLLADHRTFEFGSRWSVGGAEALSAREPFDREPG